MIFSGNRIIINGVEVDPASLPGARPLIVEERARGEHRSSLYDRRSRLYDYRSAQFDNRSALFDLRSQAYEGRRLGEVHTIDRQVRTIDTRVRHIDGQVRRLDRLIADLDRDPSLWPRVETEANAVMEEMRQTVASWPRLGQRDVVVPVAAPRPVTYNPNSPAMVLGSVVYTDSSSSVVGDLQLYRPPELTRCRPRLRGLR